MSASTTARDVQIDRSMSSSGITLQPGMPICQTDLPLDWYQSEFKSYAEEYLALPDRTPETVLPWMDSYIVPAMKHFDGRIMLLAHFYMGGEIVKLVERYGGQISDSYALARQAELHPEIDIFVESAVHFMAETIALLKHPHQEVWITNPKSGCTMETMATEAMLLPAFESLHERYGDDLLVVAYMNTSGRVKALAGRTGGAVCTSSNAHLVMQWAREQNKKIFFVPDQHLGENSGRRVGIGQNQMFLWPGGWAGSRMSLDAMEPASLAKLDASELVLWGSWCGVHTVFEPRHVEWWREKGYTVLVHPECTNAVVQVADGSGSTNYLWAELMAAEPGAKFAVGTEAHFVENARQQLASKGVEVVNLADIADPAFPSMGCGCATMSRNDPPHLVALLDLLRQGRAPQLNRVESGDVVEADTGWRERLSLGEQEQIRQDARVALLKMIELTEAAR